MTDTPSSVLLLRLQSLGSNTNTWGDTKLNVVLQMLEQASKGCQTIAVTGDATIAWTNYTAGNTGSCAALLLTGALGSPATLTFPSLQNFLTVLNTTGAQVTIKCSGGAGIAIPNGYTALLYSDGTDYKNAAPNLFPGALTISGQIHGVSTGTSSTDAVNLSQMSAAIAASVPAGTAGTLLNSITDTTRDFLANKLDVSGVGAISASWSTENPGAAEKRLLTLSVGTIALTDGGVQTTGFTAAVNTKYVARFGASGTITFPLSASAGDIIEISYAGQYVYTHNPNGLKINTSTSNYPVVGNQTYIWEYTGSTDGWV